MVPEKINELKSCLFNREDDKICSILSDQDTICSMAKEILAEDQLWGSHCKQELIVLIDNYMMCENGMETQSSGAYSLLGLVMPYISLMIASSLAMLFYNHDSLVKNLAFGIVMFLFTARLFSIPHKVKKENMNARMRLLDLKAKLEA